MTNHQTYCDHCGEKIISFADNLKVSAHDVGTVSLDLCWKCSKSLHKQFSDALDRTKEKRKEPWPWQAAERDAKGAK